MMVSNASDRLPPQSLQIGRAISLLTIIKVIRYFSGLAEVGPGY
jgi:hypothetical protein